MTSSTSTHATGRLALTWLGRLFLLAIPFVVGCSLFYPKPVRFLDDVICRDDTAITVRGNDPDTPFDNRVSCESEVLLEDGTPRVFAFAGGCVLAAAVCYTFRGHLRPRALGAPSTVHG